VFVEAEAVSGLEDFVQILVDDVDALPQEERLPALHEGQVIKSMGWQIDFRGLKFRGSSPQESTALK